MPVGPNQMDAASYKSLLSKTQEAFRSIISARELVNSFDILLQDCFLCVNQSFYCVPVALAEAKVCVEKLIEYVNDAVSMLVLLNNSIKAVIGTTLTTCCEMKTFPISVAQIIAEVYTHCKDSETLYGNYLSHVTKQMKSLHSSCHELQLTYKMVLEEHFVFNLNDMEERKMLLKALEVNLKICETVQTIDLNTVAVQWKLIMMVYDKYSEMLLNTGVFQDCMVLLCQLIRDSIKIALEANENVTISDRSWLVANFELKVLLKACCIFKNATNKKYNDLIHLLFYIHVTRTQACCLQMPAKRMHYINLIASSTKLLIEKLLDDETFANALFEYNMEMINQDGGLVGFILTLTCVMDYLTEENNVNEIVTKPKLITCLYDILAKCNSRNLHVTIWSEHNQITHTLFEHLLIHTLALVMTVNPEEYCLLEKYMSEAILSTNQISALFSSNLWTSLAMARDNNPQLLFNQIIWLCTMYKKLEKHCMFNTSPQKVHLTHTIARSFAAMENDDKIRICKQFRIHDDDNLTLWSALGVKSLPQEAKTAAEAVVAQKLKLEFQCFNSNMTPEKIDQLTKVMTVAATCTFAHGGKISEYIMRAWSATCPKQGFTPTRVEAGTTWYYNYLRALIALTETMWHHLSARNVNLIEVLHYLTSIIQQCDTEFKLLFINILCKLAATDICVTKLNDFTAAFTCLCQAGDIVRYKLFDTLKQHLNNNIDTILKGDQTLLDSWTQIKNKPDCIDSKYDTKYTNIKYIHKCLASRDTTIEISNVSEVEKKLSGNFDFDDVENLFENDKDFEEQVPAPKKVKLDGEAVESIVKRLETESALLRTMKENISVDYKSRIQSVCDELNYIIN